MDGAKIRALLPFLEAELASRRAAVETKADQLYMNGELDGEKAVQLWAETLAYRRVLRSFEQKVRFGASVGEEIAPEMNLPSRAV